MSDIYGSAGSDGYIEVFHESDQSEKLKKEIADLEKIINDMLYCLHRNSMTESELEFFDYKIMPELEKRGFF